MTNQLNRLILTVHRNY